MITYKEISCKDVINLRCGTNLGTVRDLEIDVESAKVKTIIVYGRCRLFWFFGKREAYAIKWCDIKTIGEDTILVNIDLAKDHINYSDKKIFDKIFS
ncbi:MAG: YlmC/YmxH family sporulation protein [Oscillospiraceae bacterium]